MFKFNSWRDDTSTAIKLCAWTSISRVLSVALYQSGWQGTCYLFLDYLSLRRRNGKSCSPVETVAKSCITWLHSGKGNTNIGSNPATLSRIYLRVPIITRNHLYLRGEILSFVVAVAFLICLMIKPRLFARIKFENDRNWTEIFFIRLKYYYELLFMGILYATYNCIINISNFKFLIDAQKFPSNN